MNSMNSMNFVRKIFRATIQTLVVLAFAMIAVRQASGQAMVPSDIGRRPTDGAVMVIYDSSGSMWGKVDQRHKYMIARENFARMIDQFAADRLDLDLGLTTFGHRVRGDCNDIEQIVGLQSLADPQHRQNLKNAINRLEPKGITPIAVALEFAAERLKYSEQRATVILISDGIEECGGDPCAVAGKLKKLGVAFTAHLVGFDLKREEFEKLRCVADLTGGQALLANDAASLSEALRRLNEQIRRERQESPLTTVDSNAKESPGRNDEQGRISLRTGTVATNLFIGVDPPVAFELYRIDGVDQRLVAQGQRNFEGPLPPGKYRVVALQDGARKESEFELAAGASIVAEILFGPGRILGHVVDADGRRLDSHNILWEIQRIENGQPTSAAQPQEGNQLDVAVPSGRYRITATMSGSSNGTDVTAVAEQEAPVEIKLWMPK